MSNSDQSFSWYNPESVRTTVANGKAKSIDPSRIAEYLAQRQFADIPVSRVERIVDNIPSSEDTSAATIDLSQPEATDAEPRAPVANQLAVHDLEYVSNREAARLIGLALEQFDGNTVRPPGATRVETDLVWHRQQMTVAFRIVPIPSGAVDTNHIDALLDGTVVPDDVRSPSELAIVTNQAFTDEALDSAVEHDIHCFDAGHVEEWFRRARIPMGAVGTLLEDGESHDGPLTDLVELPPIPDPRKTVDPLEINRAFDIDSLTPPSGDDTSPSTVERTDANQGKQDTGLGRSTARDDPLGGTQPPAGETGTLYADPGEDGDFEAFDRFVDEITDGNQQSNSTTDETANAGAKEANESDDKSTTYDDVDRKELLFDLLEATQDVDGRMSLKEVRTHTSYPVEYYLKEFGSIADALVAVNVEYSEESQ
ncbi:hypothetical protein [Halobellus rarus]|uniref:Restriction endonuclease n=1 Tax=Halobellus rarus TaxID=1126237 RepID=A0ABD6CQZ9_9EURY|nr:hypothetical protein [Halobellus rarus]